MTRTLRKVVRKPLRQVEFWFKRLTAQVIRWSFLKIEAPIFVTFNSSLSVDGTGAQLQRQASVMAVAKYFGFNYIHSDIKQVSVHPLDPFQSEDEYEKYLKRLNKFLKIESTGALGRNTHEKILMTLKFSFLLRECIRQLIRPKQICLNIYEPYAVTEFCPKIMDDLHLQCDEELQNDSKDNIYKIVIHYRQGVGGFALYPGQNIPREIPLDVFIGRVAKVVTGLPENLDWQIVVLTDAPESETIFAPPANQIELWEGTPGFADGIMTISPTRFDSLQKYSKLPLKIIRGGNPLDAILIMTSADVLLSGKSSLSYLGGILNQCGQVYYPKDFWHRPLKNWREL